MDDTSQPIKKTRFVEPTDDLPFGPLVMQPHGEHTGTIIWLHGLGGEASEYVEQLSEVIPAGIKCILPNAPQRMVTLHQSTMRAWCDTLTLVNDRYQRNMEQLRESVAAIHHIIERELRCVPANKIVIGGFSQGALLALYAGLSFHQELAGIVFCSGSVADMPNFHTFLYPRQQSPFNSKTPILAFHGTADPVVNYESTRQDVEFLQSNYDLDIEFIELPRVPHMIVEEEWFVIQAWLPQALSNIKPELF